MRLRLIAAIAGLALPVLAQAQSATDTENLFYKAFWLEKGERDRAGAMALYEKFLAAAPDHKLARFAATNQLALLQQTGKTKDAEAFREKHSKLLAGSGVAAAPAEGDRAEPAAEGDRPGRGRGRPEGAGARGGDPQERIKELETQLAKAKEEGNTEQADRLQRQIDRLKQTAERGGPPEGGRGMRGFGNVKKFADMTAEELGQFTGRLDGMGRMVDTMRERGNEEQAKQLEDGLKTVKQALADKKLDEAQKAWDKIVEGMRGRGR